MPEVIPIGAGVIEHEYTFGGEKIKKIGEEGTRIYLGGFEYKDGNLEHINIPNGRILKESTDRYQYNLTDHLGNVVVMFEDVSGDGVIQIEEETNGVNDEVLQRNHYYSFGMRVEMPLFNMGDDPKNKYLYNGKENADDYGLNWLDYGVRYYDAAIGRWGQIDPMAEYMSDFSSYAYAFNDPLYYNDPTGMVPDPTVEGKEGDEWEDEDGLFIHDGTEWISASVTLTEVEVTANRDGGSENETSSWTDIFHEFAFGVSNSWSSNNFIGPRVSPGSKAVEYGQMLGDILSIAQGVGEMFIGGAETAAGAGMSSTGIGALVGVPVSAMGVATTTHGGAVASHSLHNLLFAKGKKKDKMKGGKKSKRDKTFGVSDKDFWNWWHRDGKKSRGGEDITSDTIDEIFQEWIDLGRPKGSK
ncbi:MAG: RHS repeat-associated core domain-containing protein [Bacteroidota bacterium]